MTLNFGDQQTFGIGGLREIIERSPQHNHVKSTLSLGVGGPETGLGGTRQQQGQNGTAEDPGVGAAAGGGGKVLLNGEVTPGLGGVQQQQQQQQLLPPVPQPPSSWASKVRAGLGSDSSPTLAGSAGSGSSGGGVSGLGPAGDRTLLGVGDMTSGVLDPGGVGEDIQGLPHGMGHHLGPLASSIGGGGAMGPVHGLDMEGGMPGRAVQQSAASSTPGPGLVQGLVGSVGIGLGGGVGGPHQDPLQQQQQQPQQAGLRVGGEGLGNGIQGLRAGDGRRLNGSGALAQQQDFATAQDFAALEIGGGGGGSLGSRGAGAGDAKQQGFDASKNELLGDFPCVRLRGLAADTSVKDILDFFVGLGPVLDIVLESGAADGEVGAITLFGTLMDYHGALQRYSLQIKGRYIEVAPAIRPDYYSAVVKRSAAAGVSAGGAAVAATAPASAGVAGEGSKGLLQQGHNGTLRRPDVASASGGDKAPGPAAASRGTPPQGTPSPLMTGGAGGVGQHTGTTGGTAPPPPVGVPAPGAPSPLSPAVAGAHAGGVAGAAAGGAGVGGGTGARKGGVKLAKASAGEAKGTVIRMRGLPYRASKSEVMGFFKGCSIPEEGIAFVTRADGRVTGEAYVRFATREDAKMGIRKDREMMGSRYIELFTSSPEEMARYANSKR